MIQSLDNVISAAEFQKHFKRHIRSATTGQGPIAVRDGEKVIGVFVAAEEFDILYASAVRDLLRSRMKGPTVSQEDARERVRQQLKKLNRKS